MKKTIKLHWCPIRNFGDALNPYLFSKLSGCKVVYRNYTNPDYWLELKVLIKSVLCLRRYDWNRLRPYNAQEEVVLGVGSLLDRCRKNFVVWGAGYMNCFERAEGGTLLAVRGRFSAEKLHEEGFPYCSVWGDPALLLPLVYHPRREKEREVGIIPHLKELCEFKSRYPDRVIGLRTEKIEWVIDRILECRFIVSTSLHGVIVAHAYGVPAIWVKYGDIDTDGIKFRDYFDSVGIAPYEGYDIEEVLPCLESFFKEHSRQALPCPERICTIRTELLKVAPFQVLEKYSVQE